MRQEQKEHISYDRINTRYNRLWEQVTNIGLVIITVTTGYLIALKTVDKNISTILTLAQVNYILLGIAIGIVVPSTLFLGYLFLTRKELTKFFNKHSIENLS